MVSVYFYPMAFWMNLVAVLLLSIIVEFTSDFITYRQKPGCVVGVLACWLKYIFYSCTSFKYIIFVEFLGYFFNSTSFLPFSFFIFFLFQFLFYFVFPFFIFSFFRFLFCGVCVF